MIEIFNPQNKIYADAKNNNEQTQRTPVGNNAEPEPLFQIQ